MSEGQSPVPLAARRQQVIDSLARHFASDVLTMEEFERRIDIAHRATDLVALQALVSDLPTGASLPVQPRAEGRPTPAVVRGAQQYVVSVMGGVARRGRWTPAARVNVFAMMGGVELDFRDAQLADGITEVRIFCAMGGVEIVIPPGIDVDANGIALLGGFESEASERASVGSGPTLRIRGLVIMGGVDIDVRKPGESAADAKQRRKREQAARKRDG
jgi:hypothetical protein